MKRENKETILQLGVNTRISCLRPDLFPVCEATLETLFYVKEQNNFFISPTPLLQTFPYYRN